MKYKILKSIAHNFSHSFVGYTNYVDDGHVIDDLLQLARNASGERIRIQWIPETAIKAAWPARVRKSISHYREWFPNHVQNSGGSIDAIREFRTDIYLKPNKLDCSGGVPDRQSRQRAYFSCVVLTDTAG
jgi:hypothetical protein